MAILDDRVRFAILALGSACYLWSQVVGASLFGTVQDQTGAPISAAKITLTNNQTGAKRVLGTDSAGRYAIASISIGPYRITAEKEGFGLQVRTGLNLVVGQTSQIDLLLPVGEIHQVVTVEETHNTVQVSTQQTSGLINERQVKELPLNGRSYDQLMTLNPATVNYTSQRSGGVGTSNSAVGNMFAVSGHRPQENLFLLNGVEYTGASTIPPAAQAASCWASKPSASSTSSLTPMEPSMESAPAPRSVS